MSCCRVHHGILSRRFTRTKLRIKLKSVLFDSSIVSERHFLAFEWFTLNPLKSTDRIIPSVLIYTEACRKESGECFIFS